MRLISIYVPAALFLLTVVLIVIFPQPVNDLKALINEGGLYGYVMFVLLLIVATVLMPVTVMPIIPMSSAVFGPFPTAILSIVGWTLGAVIAFFVARYIGRPVLERFVSMKRIDAIGESLPTKYRFITIVLLRLTIPVDIASYALGLTKSVHITEYILATIIGVSWFSFAFAYLGDALLTGNMPLFIELGAFSLLIFIAGWYMLRSQKLKAES
ncbi:VTT domain-containing protein [Candidatus Pacebacteria bacterium]|nr:VTT domain-containing protein [Candidatus Paceibacterota bacterium]